MVKSPAAVLANPVELDAQLPGQELTRALLYLTNVDSSVSGALEMVSRHPDRWWHLNLTGEEGRVTLQLDPVPIGTSERWLVTRPS